MIRSGKPTWGANMLEVSSLWVNIGRIRIIQDISLTVGDNEIVSVLGPNGAGKTTLLRAISGLLAIASGQVNFMGRDITGLKPHQIATRGLRQIPERARVFPLMTVYENLQLGAWTRKDGRQIGATLKRIYELFPVLEERRRQTAGTLSGGERQLLAIGRALMSNPRLLLLDEPTLGLAPIMCQQLDHIIAELHKQGASILLVEQNANFALRVSQRGYVMNTGRVVLSGTCSDLGRDDSIRRTYLGTD